MGRRSEARPAARPGLRAAGLAAALGCAMAAPGPDDTLAAYREALLRDDPRAAYELLSPAERRRLPYDGFVARWRGHSAERRAQAEALARAGQPRRTAQAADVELRFEDGAWRLAGGAAPGLRHGRPEDAVAALLRAAERRDLRAFLALLAPESRRRLEDAIDRRAARLRTALDRPVQVDGDRAVLHYDPALRIELRREHGQWRIVDLN